MATEQKNTKAANKWNIPNDWEEIELGKLVDEKRPVSYGIVQTGDLVENGIPCIRVTDIVNGKIDNSSLITTSKKISDSYKRTILKKGDLVMALRGKIGQIAKIEDELVGANLTRGVALIAVKNTIDCDFLKQQISSDKATQVFERSLNGSALQELSIGIIRKIPIIIPKSLPEQKAIAKVLSTIDEAIQKHQQLIAQKEQRKKWLMQQLLTGKKRLKGFIGEWKEVSLGDYIIESRIPSKENNPDNRITVKLNQNGIEKRSVRGTESEDSTAYFIRKAGQFIYGKQNLHKGAFGIIPLELDGFESSQDIPTFDFRSNILPSFFLFYMSQESFYTGLEKISTGTGSKRIHPEELYKVKVVFPEKEEQNCIAQVLQAADKEISLLKAKTEKLKEQKKGMMQVLLTGKKRLRVE